MLSPRGIRGLGALLLAWSPPVAEATAGYVFRTVDDPSAVGDSLVTGITNSGQIVGYYLGAADASHGFVATQSGGIFNFVTYDVPLVSNTFISDLNNSGQLAGSVNVGGELYGFMGSTSSSNVEELNPIGSVNAFAYGINDPGTAVGSYAVVSGTAIVSYGFATSDGGKTFTTLNDPQSDTNTQAYCISNNGTIVGTYQDSNRVDHGFVAAPGPGGTYIYTTLDDPSGSGGTVVRGINDLGQIVGYYYTSGNDPRGFVATPTGSTYTFTNLDDPHGVRGTYGLGIDDSGTVVGYYVDANNVSHGFIASATPEPSSFVLMAIGALGLCGRRLLTRRAFRVGRPVGDPPSHRRGLSPRSIGVANRQ
jgi:uncharacterized membrane protein